MNPQPTVDKDDLNKLLELLREYTGKLRLVCEERMTDRWRLMSVAAVMITVLITLAGVVMALALKGSSEMQTTEPFILSTISAIGGSVAVILAMMMFTTRRRFRTSFDARYLFGTVERLVRTSSQYSEHASQRLSDKFLFDLRLAEAEAVLQVYRELYHVPENGPAFSVFTVTHHAQDHADSINIGGAVIGASPPK